MKDKSSMSHPNRAIICAYERGYRVLPDGSVTGIRTKKLSSLARLNGYPCFGICVAWMSRSVNIYVHRLCAYQKFGDAIFSPDIQVRHLNGNRADNRFDNIAIGTMSDNCMDKPAHIRKRAALIAGRANSPLDEQDVITIRNRLADGAIYSEIMREYGIAKSTVSYIKNRITWRDI